MNKLTHAAAKKVFSGIADESPLVFCVQVRLYNYNGKLKPGTYLISTAYTPARIMGILAGETEEQKGATT